MTISDLYLETLTKIERKRISTPHAEMLMLSEPFWEKLNVLFSTSKNNIGHSEENYIDSLIDDMIENEL